MAIQTTYDERMQKALPGLIKGSDFDTKTGIVETEDGIGFGLPVSQGEGDQGVVLGGAAFLGITVRDVTQEPTAELVDAYPRYRNCAYIQRGEVWVTVDVDVVPGDPVHYNATTGVWSKTSGQTVDRARYATTAAGGGLALVQLR